MEQEGLRSRLERELAWKRELKGLTRTMMQRNRPETPNTKVDSLRILPFHTRHSIGSLVEIGMDA